MQAVSFAPTAETVGALKEFVADTNSPMRGH